MDARAPFIPSLDSTNLNGTSAGAVIKAATASHLIKRHLLRERHLLHSAVGLLDVPLIERKIKVLIRAAARLLPSQEKQLHLSGLASA